MLINEAERRAFRRLPVDCAVEFKEQGRKEPLRGTGQNLSGNGILFLSDRAVPVGTELEIHLIPSVTRINPMSAIVKVVRSEPRANRFAIAGSIQRVVS